jgi:hypothetical protein
MKFSQLISLILNGDECHYLTTQDVQSNQDGRPDILPEFMKDLMSSDYFPMQPSLMGKLIPQNINLWMGNNTTTKGSSSGLHHDYHDNLYIVLSGRKRFRLFAPSDVTYLYPRGVLLKVHPNGRINYVNEETSAYGADVGADAAARAARRHEDAVVRLEAAERAIREGKKDDDAAEEELMMAEVELEEAMDGLIDAEYGSDDDGEIDDGDGGEVEMFDGTNKRRLVDKTVKNPNNFSKIPARMLDDISKPCTEFPELHKATMAYCHVSAGEMLYLPASWFHEVTSYGVEGASCHLALNYWYVLYDIYRSVISCCFILTSDILTRFHPPDGNDFESPYSSDFWPNDFKDRYRGDKVDS